MKRRTIIDRIPEIPTRDLQSVVTIWGLRMKNRQETPIHGDTLARQYYRGVLELEKRRKQKGKKPK